MKSVKEIPSRRLEQAEIAALARIHLWVTGETHLRINEFGRQARAILVRRAGKDGVFDGASGYQAQTEILAAWGDTQAAVVKFMQLGMAQAARLPFALLAEEYERRVAPLVETAMAEKAPLASPKIAGERNLWGKPLNEGVSTTYGGWVEQQFRGVVDAANSRVIEGLNLSGRIWQQDRQAREGINRLILQALSSKQDAWSLAKDLEQYLGANQDCPRWTSSRLYGLTKEEIASGNLQGLVTGKACDGQGVAYNALRLARTEIQAIHDAATTAKLASSPWVQKERIVLSEGHPETDICDDVTGGGEDGKGIYPVGTQILPLHPNCLCYKVAVTMSDDEFVRKMRGWLAGSQDWPEMDVYSQNISGGGAGALSKTLLNAEAALLDTWLFGTEKDLEKVMQ